MTAIALKVKSTTRPVSGKITGWRIVMAHVNKARYDVLSGEYVQSFAPCYRICESGDYTDVTPEILERYVARMSEWHNIEIDQIIPYN